MDSTSPLTNKQYSIDFNKTICDSLNCESDATKNIDIDCGKYGTLTISVCNNCLCKFCHISNITERIGKEVL